MPRLLHCLSQRPMRTGSGVTLDALVREAGARGWDQYASFAIPIGETAELGGLPADRLHPLMFGGDQIPFAVPGMSDVMPYPSTRFGDMDEEQWATYRAAWREHLCRVVDAVRPDVIHSHHVWLMSALLGDVAPEVPVVTHCHATGLRQMQLCPERADEVRAGVARNERFVVLHAGHAEALAPELGVARERVHVVGAGYRDDVFTPREGIEARDPAIVYVGKIAAAKGVGELCDAFERVRTRRPEAQLHVAGSGAGPEAEALRRRLEALGASLHGHLDPPALAAILRQCRVCVLPSYYEGLPLVLVEAAASGCRLVSTRLPGVVEQIAPHLRETLQLVDLPRLRGPDTPEPEDLPAFVERLAEALLAALAAPAAPVSPNALAPFTWRAVFERIEAVWRSVQADG